MSDVCKSGRKRAHSAVSHLPEEETTARNIGSKKTKRDHAGDQLEDQGMDMEVPPPYKSGGLTGGGKKKAADHVQEYGEPSSKQSVTSSKKKKTKVGGRPFCVGKLQY